MGTQKAIPCVRVNVKVAPGPDRHRAIDILSRAPGVRNVIQTFPGEADEELTRLYLLEVDSASLNSVLEQLRHSPDVEYAEVASPWKLIW